MVVGAIGVAGILALYRVEVVINIEGDNVTVLHLKTEVLTVGSLIVRVMENLAQKVNDVIYMIVQVSQK